MLQLSGVAQAAITQYLNPLDVSIADPQVLRDGDTYYLYGTTEPDGFSVFTSTDLVHWSRRGYCWKKTASSWGQDNFWAPEVIKHNGGYYLFYTAYNPALNKRNICVAASASPLGPFVDVAAPLLPTTMGFIDGHPYQDPATGKVYLYVCREDVNPARIMVTELTNPPVATSGSLTTLFSTSQAWEGGWVEAPFLFRRNGTYYMMYSARAYWEAAYSVGYATATNPLGPWTKASINPILKQTATVSGPGHNAVVESPDGSELFAIYHTHLTFAGGGARQLAIDRLKFTAMWDEPDRLTLTAGGPTTTLQPLPAGAVPRAEGTSDEFGGAALDRTRWNIFGEEPTRWSLNSGMLEITTENGDLHQDRLDGHNVLLQYAPGGAFEFETLLHFSPVANFEQAFLVLWQDQSNYIRFGRVYAGGQRVEVGVERDGIYTGNVVGSAWGNPVRLRITVDAAGTARCYASINTANPAWSQVGSDIAFPMGRPQMGLGAMAPLSGAARLARFEYFRLGGQSAVSDWQLY